MNRNALRKVFVGSDLPDQVNIQMGFALGFFADNQRDIQSLPGSAPEILRDIIEIAGADTQTDEPDDNDTERALTEIEEYLRVGAQLVFEEIQDELKAVAEAQADAKPGTGNPTPDDPTVH